MKNVNPFLTLLIIAGIFVAGIFIGRSKWFNDLLLKVLPTPAPLPNGTVCTMPDGSAGKINGGVCVKDIGIPDTTASQRTQGNGNVERDALINSLISKYKSFGRSTTERTTKLRNSLSTLQTAQLVNLNTQRQNETCIGQYFECMLEPQSKPETCWNYYLDCDASIYYTRYSPNATQTPTVAGGRKY